MRREILFINMFGSEGKKKYFKINLLTKYKYSNRDHHENFYTYITIIIYN